MDKSIELLKNELDIINKELQDIYNEQERKERQYYEENQDLDDYEPYEIQQLNNLHDKKTEVENAIRQKEYEDKNKQNKSKITKLKHININLLNDTESVIDLLDRNKQAEAIAKLICNKETKPPLRIGVYGPWGSGKSTFVSFIEKSIHQLNTTHDGKYSKVHIVKYDATQYDDYEKIWYSLLSSFFEKYKSDQKLKGKFKYILGRDFISNLRKNIVWIINVVLILVLIVILLNFYFDVSIVKTFYLKVSITSAFVISTIVFLSNLYKKVTPYLYIFKEKWLIPNYDKFLGSREEVKKSMNRLIECWLKREERIVVIVEELDRCSEKTISEFFSALQLFLNFKEVIMVISMNQERVKRVLKNSLIKYDDRIDIDDYLKKYINIQFELPKTWDVEFFTKSILENDHNNFFDENEIDEITKQIAKSTSLFSVTPREVKLIINNLIYCKEYYIHYYNSTDAKHYMLFLSVIRYYIFQYFNKEIAEVIHKHVVNKCELSAISFNLLINNINLDGIKLNSDIIKYLKEVYSDLELITEDIIVSQKILSDSFMIHTRN